MDFGSGNIELEEAKVVTGQLIGANLIWARAQFDKKANELVQINQWVKLSLEIFTKLKGNGVELQNI